MNLDNEELMLDNEDACLADMGIGIIILVHITVALTAEFDDQKTKQNSVSSI